MSNSALMTSKSAKASFNNYSYGNFQWCWVSSKSIDNYPISPEPLKNIWVRLIDDRHADLEQEVLLLCPQSDREWVVWNPESGEEIISVNQFCLVP